MELTIHASIKTETGQVTVARAQYYQQQLDDQRKFIEHKIPAAVAKIEDKVGEAFRDDEYAELLSFEDKVRTVFQDVLDTLTLADLPEQPQVITSTLGWIESNECQISNILR